MGQPARLDDRWPDRFAAVMFLASALVLVSAAIPSLRHYFAQDDDVVSMLTIPIIPNIVYAALLACIAVALHRRLRAAWWVLVIWWLLLPQVGRIVDLADGRVAAQRWWDWCWSPRGW